MEPLNRCASVAARARNRPQVDAALAAPNPKPKVWPTSKQTEPSRAEPSQSPTSSQPRRARKRTATSGFNANNSDNNHKYNSSSRLELYARLSSSRVQLSSSLAASAAFGASEASEPFEAFGASVLLRQSPGRKTTKNQQSCEQ